ncbi:hypothetical protein PMAYCL1PPCAC_28116, partial [Pristionchus mayeri]
QMQVRNCVVCGNRSDEKQMHKFTDNVLKRRIWVNALATSRDGRKTLNEALNTCRKPYLCAAHFGEDQYIHSLTSTVLKKDAVPLCAETSEAGSSVSSSTDDSREPRTLRNDPAGRGMSLRSRRFPYFINPTLTDSAGTTKYEISNGDLFTFNANAGAVAKDEEFEIKEEDDFQMDESYLLPVAPTANGIVKEEEEDEASGSVEKSPSGGAEFAEEDEEEEASNEASTSRPIKRRTCIVCHKKCEERQMHKFTANAARRMRWVQALHSSSYGRKSLMDLLNTTRKPFLCSSHFSKNQYANPDSFVLRFDALPINVETGKQSRDVPPSFTRTYSVITAPRGNGVRTQRFAHLPSAAEKGAVTNAKSPREITNADLFTSVPSTSGDAAVKKEDPDLEIIEDNFVREEDDWQSVSNDYNAATEDGNEEDEEEYVAPKRLATFDPTGYRDGDRFVLRKTATMACRSCGCKLGSPNELAEHLRTAHAAEMRGLRRDWQEQQWLECAACCNVFHAADDHQEHLIADRTKCSMADARLCWMEKE